MENFQDHNWMMKLALEQAERAYVQDEVPVGAIVLSPNGEVLAETHNLKESVHNPCGHAELLAIEQAAKKIGNWRLENCKIYVTLEPCPMCLGAITQARIKTLIFGAYDPKCGAISLGYNLYKDKRLNHNFSVMGGVAHLQCSKMLSEFFKSKRGGYTAKQKLES
jgi:tRNA(adenine34) deaminase